MHLDSLQGAHQKTLKKHGERKIQPALSGIKLALERTLTSTKLMESEQHKSHAICKLHQTKIKSRCIN